MLFYICTLSVAQSFCCGRSRVSFSFSFSLFHSFSKRSLFIANYILFAHMQYTLTLSLSLFLSLFLYFSSSLCFSLYKNELELFERNYLIVGDFVRLLLFVVLSQQKMKAIPFLSTFDEHNKWFGSCRNDSNCTFTFRDKHLLWMAYSCAFRSNENSFVHCLKLTPFSSLMRDFVNQMWKMAILIWMEIP